MSEQSLLEARVIAEEVSKKFKSRISSIVIISATYERDGEQHPYLIVLDKNEAADKKDLANDVRAAREIPGAYRIRMQSRLGILSCRYNELFYFPYKKSDIYGQHADFFATLIDNAYCKGKQWDPVRKDFVPIK